MRFLHSADWHLGRVYHGVSLLEDQAHVLQQFVRIAADTDPTSPPTEFRNQSRLEATLDGKKV